MPLPLTAPRAESPLAFWKAALLLTGATCLCARLSAPLPFTPVPVTLQVFAVLLSGLILGSRGGALAQMQYLLLGALGLPVFALGTGGAHILFGVTGGYLWSYPCAAYVVGRMAERSREAKSAEDSAEWKWQAAGCAMGLAVIYGMGCTWLMLTSRPLMTPLHAVLAGASWFVVWDAAKAMAAMGVARTLQNIRHSRG